MTQPPLDAAAVAERLEHLLPMVTAPELVAVMQDAYMLLTAMGEAVAVAPAAGHEWDAVGTVWRSLPRPIPLGVAVSISCGSLKLSIKPPQ